MTISSEELPTTRPPLDAFRFERPAFRVMIEEGGEVLPLVNAHSDAEDLARLIDYAQKTGLISHQQPGIELKILPLSIAKPDPLLAVKSPHGPVMFGGKLKLRQRGGEDPVAYTARFLDHIVHSANGLLAAGSADTLHLDRIADFLKREGPADSADLYAAVTSELKKSGRPVDK